MRKKQEHGITTKSDVQTALITIRHMASAIGFTGDSLTEIEIAVSELAASVLKYGGASSQLVVQEVSKEGSRGIGIGIRDGCSVIVNLEETLRGGAVTRGTLTFGLSAFKCHMIEARRRIEQGSGVALKAKKWVSIEQSRKLSFSLFSRPCWGETLSGDACFVKQLPIHTVFCIVDALGHGPEAHAVAQQAMCVLDAFYMEDLGAIVQRCHDRLTRTRGAAIGLCRVHFWEGRVEFLGVGNVAVRIYGSPTPVYPASLHGTLGVILPALRPFQCKYEPGMRFVMYSDGISERFNLETAELRLTLQELALHVMTSHGKFHDDATVLVAR